MIVAAVLFAVYEMVEWKFDQRAAEPVGAPAASAAPKAIQRAAEPPRQALDATVKNLDARSCQPEGPQMMDWIKAERKKARNQ